MKEEDTKYLKSEQHYSDLYDRFTVEECRRWEKRGVTEDHEEIETDPKKKKIKQDFIVKVVMPTALYFVKGEHYLKKAETIREWMVSDEAKDDLLDSAKAPEDIRCLTCGSVMSPNFKDLCSWLPGKEERVLFMYDCPNGHFPRRSFFDNGEEYRPKPHLCPKCGKAMDHANEKLKDKIITTYACDHCGHKDKEELDFSTKKEKIDKDFVKDREKFCLTEEEGKEYLDFKIRQEGLSRLMKDWKEKEKTQKALVGIKKLPVAGLSNFLAPILEKEGYIKLEFAKPEIGRDLIIQFDIQESKIDREEYDSVHHLQKLIKSALEDTNWRLMSDGINYKLGILTGRLRGYENDEDLLKLVNK